MVDCKKPPINNKHLVELVVIIVLVHKYRIEKCSYVVSHTRKGFNYKLYDKILLQALIELFIIHTMHVLPC